MFIDPDLDDAASHHATKHLTKLILEATQMASTALHNNGLDEIAPYRPCHTAHPMTRWAGESFDNWLHLRQYASALHDEHYGYSHEDIVNLGEYERHELLEAGRLHKSMNEFSQIPEHLVGEVLPNIGMTARPCCTPDVEFQGTVTETYREYYRSVKEPEDWFEWNEEPNWNA